MATVMIDGAYQYVADYICALDTIDLADDRSALLLRTSPQLGRMATVHGLPIGTWLLSRYSQLVGHPPTDELVIYSGSSEGGPEVMLLWPGVAVMSDRIGYLSPKELKQAYREATTRLALRAASVTTGTMRFIALSGIQADTVLTHLAQSLSSFLETPRRDIDYDYRSTKPEIEIDVHKARSEIRADRWEQIHIKVAPMVVPRVGVAIMCVVTGSWNTGGNSPPRSYPKPIPENEIEAYATRLCDFIERRLSQ